jgi:hypothetical protein
MVFGLGKNVGNETQSSLEGHIEIVKLFLVLFVRLMFLQYEACFIFIKKIYSSYDPRT